LDSTACGFGVRRNLLDLLIFFDGFATTDEDIMRAHPHVQVDS
jgi:hypothetical protein